MSQSAEHTKAGCVHLRRTAGKHGVIPYGKWHPVTVRWGSINSYTLPLPSFFTFNNSSNISCCVLLTAVRCSTRQSYWLKASRSRFHCTETLWPRSSATRIDSCRHWADTWLETVPVQTHTYTCCVLRRSVLERQTAVCWWELKSAHSELSVTWLPPTQR